jgi:hypothetical protein
MAPLLGTTGTVERVWDDGDVRVKGKCWNPALVERQGAAASGLQVGSRVEMRVSDAAADWAGCPGTRLSFSPGWSGTVQSLRNGFFTTTRYTTLWAPVSAALPGAALSQAQIEALPRLRAAEGQRLASGTNLVFKKVSGSRYPDACADEAPVEFLQTNGGLPPAQVRWPSGFTYWCEWEDLRVPSVGGGGGGAAAASSGRFVVGESVRIRSVAVDEARRLQDGHGERNRFFALGSGGSWVPRVIVSAALALLQVGGRTRWPPCWAPRARWSRWTATATCALKASAGTQPSSSASAAGVLRRGGAGGPW